MLHKRQRPKRPETDQATAGEARQSAKPPTEKFDEKTRVKIRGEVEKDFLATPEIDVDSVVLIK